MHANAQTNSQIAKTLRIGYFPNINHAQAVIGLNNGDFQKILGNNTKIETIVFNAGPSAIEALLANRIDATYIGPNPAINGYVASGRQRCKNCIRGMQAEEHPLWLEMTQEYNLSKI